MKFNWNELEKIGEGSEKDVFADSHNPDRVIARFKETEAENERQTRGRFYLSKILHLLLPQNIPDVHLSAKGGERVMVFGKKNLDEESNELRKGILRLTEMKRAGDPRFTETLKLYKEIRDALWVKLHSDSNYREFIGRMRRFGVIPDEAPFNFGYDKEGNLVYLDNEFTPWSITEIFGVLDIRYHFNKKKISEAISSLNERDKERALIYLGRIEKLAEEDLGAARTAAKNNKRIDLE